MRHYLLALAALVACGDDDAATNNAAKADGGGSSNVDGGASSPSDGGTASDAQGVNPNPTVSSFIGTNVAADLSRVDITYQLEPFSSDPANLDEHGLPKAGVTATSSTDAGFILPSGSYRISYEGTGEVTVAGDIGTAAAWTTVGNEHRSTIAITATPGQFGRFLRITIKNGANQTVSNLKILAPGHDFGTKELFLPEFMRALTPFRALRFMDWEHTNGSTLADWANRPRADRFGKAAAGEPYEHLAELVNLTGKDAWVTIPERATAAFTSSFAAFLATNLDWARIQAARDRAGYTTPFRLYVEISNETWNQGFAAYGTLLAAANADQARYGGAYDGTYGPSWMSGNADLMKVARVQADRLVAAGTAFRTAFAGHESAISPVLAGWAIGTVFSDAGLRFIAAKHGPPKNHVSFVAQAPYFSTEDPKTGSLEQLFTALNEEIASKETLFKDFAKLGTEHGVGIIAYEGGQHLIGTANQQIKHLAQHDKRMYDAYKTYLALWEKVYGKSLFAHFSLAGTPGVENQIFQYGYWGSLGGIQLDTATCGNSLTVLTGTEPLASVVGRCPKYKALTDVLQ